MKQEPELRAWVSLNLVDGDEIYDQRLIIHASTYRPASHQAHDVGNALTNSGYYYALYRIIHHENKKIIVK